MDSKDKNNGPRINAGLINYRLDAMQKGIDALLSKADNYVSITDYLKLQSSFELFKKDVETNYVKKNDNKTLRNIGVTVLTAAAVSITTLIITFITGGGLNNGK